MFAEGMGMWRGLASCDLRCLAARGSSSDVCSTGSRARTNRLMVASLASSPMSDIDEKGSGCVWDGNGVE